MRLDKESYRKAEGCLRRYNYNYLRIIELRADIMSIGSPAYDGMPKAPYNISDSVFNTYKKLCEDKELNNVLNEFKAVDRALKLVDKDCIEIFERLYQKQESKWKIQHELHFSDETYKRRKRKLIYTTDEELKKLTQNWPFLSKISSIINIVEKYKTIKISKGLAIEVSSFYV